MLERAGSSGVLLAFQVALVELRGDLIEDRLEGAAVARRARVNIGELCLLATTHGAPETRLGWPGTRDDDRTRHVLLPLPRKLRESVAEADASLYSTAHFFSRLLYAGRTHRVQGVLAAVSRRWRRVGV
jgi:hypothetical protein